MTEEWRAIPGYEGRYEVSNQGRVRSIFRKNIRVLRPDVAGGYRQVLLSDGVTSRRWKVHRLVLLAFVGPPSADKPLCRHLDGDRLNNVPSNLMWGSASENTLDMVGHGRHFLAMRTHCPRGHEYTAENTRFDPERRCVTCRRERSRAASAERRRLNRERRALEPPRPKFSPAGKPLDLAPETVAAIRAAYQPGVRGSGGPALGKRFGVSTATVAKIVAGKGHWGRAE